MKDISKTIVISVLVMALTSCSAIASKPTETPLPTATNMPTATSTPTATDLPTLTSTPEPTITPTPTKKPTKTPVLPTDTQSAPVLSMPTGTPVTNWEGIPVMPSAIAGDGDGKGYSFTIKATPAEVQQFYDKAMSKLGWQAFAAGEGTTDAIFLIFMKGSNTMSVSIVPQPDGLLYVMLVK